jgi:hypothetical protein
MYDSEANAVAIMDRLKRSNTVGAYNVSDDNAISWCSRGWLFIPNHHRMYSYLIEENKVIELINESLIERTKYESI